MDDVAKKKPWRIWHAYSLCHTSGDVWMQIFWPIQAKFFSTISAFAWAVDLEWP